MTQKEFCKQIIQMVDNCRDIDGLTDDELAERLTGLLEHLEPRDRVRFAKWGFPEQKSTPKECWN